MSESPSWGLIIGTAAAAVAGAAAGVQLERRLLRNRVRPPAEVWETNGFFGLRSDARHLDTPDGVRIHVEVDAPAAWKRGEPTLIFVHGYAMDLDCWHFQRRHFRGRRRMILFDLRSHGRSSRSEPDRCRIPQLAEDLAQVIREVAGSGPVILIGHSMGGMTIMELARQRPEWFGAAGPVIGVGLICTSSDDLLTEHPIRGLRNRSVEPTLAALNRVPTVVERSRKAGSDLAYLATRILSFPTPVPAATVRFVGELLSVTPLEVLAEFYPALVDLDLTEGLPVINSVPTTVIGARQDLVTPFRHTELLISELPDAESLVLDPGGHLAMIEHPEQVNQALDRLVRRAIETRLSSGGAPRS